MSSNYFDLCAVFAAKLRRLNFHIAMLKKVQSDFQHLTNTIPSQIQKIQQIWLQLLSKLRQSQPLSKKQKKQILIMDPIKSLACIKKGHQKLKEEIEQRLEEAQLDQLNHDQAQKQLKKKVKQILEGSSKRRMLKQEIKSHEQMDKKQSALKEVNEAAARTTGSDKQLFCKQERQEQEIGSYWA